MSIDASFRSTGIVIREETNYEFYIITNKMTKKQSVDKLINYREYNKNDDKTQSLNNYIDVLQKIIDETHPDKILIEDTAFVSNSRSTVDLGILQGAIRALAHFNRIPIHPINNQTWKKEVLGNAGIDKEYTVMSFKRLQPQFKDYTTSQINDLADSFMISLYNAI